jgi:hypothetical protein
MTRRERERVRRAAAFIAIGEGPLSAEVEPDRWRALQRWRGDEGAALGDQGHVGSSLRVATVARERART